MTSRTYLWAFAALGALALGCQQEPDRTISRDNSRTGDSGWTVTNPNTGHRTTRTRPDTAEPARAFPAALVPPLVSTESTRPAAAWKVHADAGRVVCAAGRRSHRSVRFSG